MIQYQDALWHSRLTEAALNPAEPLARCGSATPRVLLLVSGGLSFYRPGVRYGVSTDVQAVLQPVRPTIVQPHIAELQPARKVLLIANRALAILPTACPELNPAGRFSRQTRIQLANAVFDSMGQAGFLAGSPGRLKT